MEKGERGIRKNKVPGKKNCCSSQQEHWGQKKLKDERAEDQDKER